MIFLAVAAVLVSGLVFDPASSIGLRGAGAVLVLLGLLAGGALVASRPADGSRSREQVETVRALRWLRANSPVPGPWNAAGAPQEWGVLREPRLAALVHYHAGRPTVATDSGLGREALEAEHPAQVAAAALALGARYVVARAGAGGRAFEALAAAPDAAPEGLECVHAAVPAAGGARPLAIFRVLREP